MAALELNLECAAGIDAPIDAGGFERAAAIALRADRADRAADDGELIQIDVRLVDRFESAQLNAEHRGKAKATNVLSFPIDARMPGLRMLGDLVICVPVVIDEARDQSKTVVAHLTHMLVHGVLHLLGFDHIGDDEAEIMEDTERRVMAELGYDDPYRIPVAD